MPFLLKELSSDSLRKPALMTDMIAIGGATLKDLWEDSSVISKLKNNRWDFVAIQDQTTFGDFFLVNGEEKIRSPQLLFTYGEKFDSLIKLIGAKTIVYMRPYYSNANSIDKNASNHAYYTLAKKTNALLAPISLLVERLKYKYELYREDSLHPSAVSSYIIATYFHLLLKKGLPSSPKLIINGPPVEEAEGKVMNDSTSQLINLNNKVVKAIQKDVLDFFLLYQRKGPAYFIKQPRRTTVPILPETYSWINKQALLGTWIGKSKLYPRYLKWPAYLELNFLQKNNDIRVVVTLDFGSSNRFVSDTLAVKVDKQEIKFINPKGPNGSSIVYKAIMTTNTLKGIGEFIKPNDDFFYAIGEWSAKKLNDNGK